VIHKVIFEGLLSPLFGKLVGSGIRRGLPNTLKGLKKIVESAES